MSQEALEPWGYEPDSDRGLRGKPTHAEQELDPLSPADNRFAGDTSDLPASNILQSRYSLHILFQGNSAGWCRQGTWCAHLAQGEVALCVGTTPPEWDIASGTLHTFGLDGQTAAGQHLLPRLPTVLRQGMPATTIMTGVIAALQPAHALPPYLAWSLTSSLLSMLTATLECQGESARGHPPKLAQFHLARIKDCLLERLRQPNVQVKDVAEEVKLSISQVHRIFAHEGCSVLDWLWFERLKRCASDLCSAAHAHRTVGEIAFFWGFAELGHFSRAFRARFGCSPKEWRKRAQDIVESL